MAKSEMARGTRIVPRPYHSPSSLALGARCEYAWTLRYVAGIRDVEIEWADIASGRVKVVPAGEPITDPKRQCRAKQRSASLGKAMHRVGELSHYCPQKNGLS